MKNIEFEPHVLGGIELTRILVNGKPVGMIGRIRDYINARIITPTPATIFDLAGHMEQYSVILVKDLDNAKKIVVNGSQHSDFEQQKVFDKFSEAIHYATKRLEEIA